MITIKNIYNVLKNSVQFYPTKEFKCLQPQTFAVLDSIQAINTENLDKVFSDKDKPYFYSRLWESLRYNPSNLKFEFPAIIIFETGFVSNGLFTKSVHNCFNLQVLSVDTYKEDACKDCKDATKCDTRTINEIFDTTEVILQNCLDYLSETVITMSGDVFNKNHYEYIVQNNNYPHEINNALTSRFQSSLRKNNVTSNGFRWEGKGANNLYGTVINITVCLDSCYEDDFNFKALNVEPVNDLGCC